MLVTDTETIKIFDNTKIQSVGRTSAHDTTAKPQKTRLRPGIGHVNTSGRRYEKKKKCETAKGG